MSTSPLIFDPYVVNNVQGSRFLDVGCGYGKWGYLLKKHANLPGKLPYVVGIDIFEPHVCSLSKEGIYDEVITGNATSLPFADKSFDSVIACEIIEHLSREDGYLLIRELKRVAKYCVVVSTPSFQCIRGGNNTLDGFNPYEAHRYIYSYQGFRSLGFTQIIGVGRLKFRPWKLSVALSSLGLYMPWLSRYLLGFWFADGKKRVLAVE